MDAARNNCSNRLKTSPMKVIFLYPEDYFKMFHILSDPEEDWKGPKGFINAEFI